MRINNLKIKIERLLFFLPYFILFTIFFLVPVLTIFPISLTNWNIVGNPVFIGLKNYIHLFKDDVFYEALKNTVYYSIANTLGLTIIGLLLALLLNQKIKGRLIGRTSIMIAYVLSSAAVGILWRWLYDSNFGIINNYLNQLGLPRINWLTNVNIAMISLIIMALWWALGFSTIVYLAALQGIPQELYEAAKVDGASGFQLFRFITIPSLLPVILYIMVLYTSVSFQVFDEVYV